MYELGNVFTDAELRAFSYLINCDFNGRARVAAHSSWSISQPRTDRKRLGQQADHQHQKQPAYQLLPPFIARWLPTYEPAIIATTIGNGE